MLNLSLTVKNHSLRKGAPLFSIGSTNDTDGRRNRHLSGIFLSKIPFNGRFCLSEKAEFATRATRGNKASNRTNNAERSVSLVEPLPHPITTGNGSKLLTNTETIQMKTFQKSTALSGVFAHLRPFICATKSRLTRAFSRPQRFTIDDVFAPSALSQGTICAIAPLSQQGGADNA